MVFWWGLLGTSSRHQVHHDHRIHDWRLLGTTFDLKSSKYKWFPLLFHTRNEYLKKMLRYSKCLEKMKIPWKNWKCLVYNYVNFIFHRKPQIKHLFLWTPKLKIEFGWPIFHRGTVFGQKDWCSLLLAAIQRVPHIANSNPALTGWGSVLATQQSG